MLSMPLDDDDVPGTLSVRGTGLLSRFIHSSIPGARPLPTANHLADQLKQNEYIPLRDGRLYRCGRAVTRVELNASRCVAVAS